MYSQHKGTIWFPFLFVGLCSLMYFAPGVEVAHAACTHVQTYRLGGSNLRIRSQSNTSSSTLGQVPEGTCLAVQQQASGQSINGNSTWYKITYQGATGWISGYYAQCSNCGGPPPECTVGQTRPCYSGSASTINKGTCKEGVQGCIAGKWGSCAGDVTPISEKCDGKDNDCDGSTDEGNPGGGGTCSTGQPGSCGQGTNTCQGGKIVCKASTPSSPEICDGKDNNCNGSIDEGNPGGGKTCSTGQSGACGQGVGQCQNGKITCKTTATGGNELCDNKDNNCDGSIDEGLKRACYTGPANTNGVGICSGGEQTCQGGQWGSCQGELTPQPKEICGNTKDDNCNGQTDEGCNGQGCTTGQTQPCYTGPANTRDKGYCKSGKQTCTNGQWGPCQGERTPQAKEVCNNQTDDNCDGQIDEGQCQGPQGTCEDKDKDGYGVGSTCQQPLDCDDNDPNVHPKASEICGNGKDDDCKDGDLPCGKLGIGEAGCTKPSECTSNICLAVGDVQRCSKECKINSDCPAGYTCLQGKYCWPPNKGQGTGAKACTVTAQCADDEVCDRGFCAKRTGCGCSATTKHQSPFQPLFLILLVGLWCTQRRTRRKTNDS